MACRSSCISHSRLFFNHHHHYHCKDTSKNTYSFYICRPPCNSMKFSTDPKSSARFNKHPKSSLNKNPSTSPQKPKSTTPENVDGPDPDPDYYPPSTFSSRLWEAFKVDGIVVEILSIALPVALALAAEPITSLVDTAFVGHLGSVELAAVGVSVSVYNLVSKLFNVPLLNITTSFVAEEQAITIRQEYESAQTVQDFPRDQQSKILLPSVSTSLALAAALGIAEAVALTVGSGFLMNVMGIPPADIPRGKDEMYKRASMPPYMRYNQFHMLDSPMRLPAEQYLTLRAFGTPPIVLALAAQGTFRGFKDTKIPLYAVGAGNILNAILDPILIFSFDLGIRGAAMATVISEFLTAFILLWKLNDKVSLIAPNIDGGRIAQYLKSGGLLTGRSLAVLLTLTLGTSMAAREGPIPMAGYQISIEVWMALSLLNDALALAGQALLATDYSQGNYKQARHVLYKVLQIGLVMGLALSIILFFGFGALSNLFSTDSEVLQIAGFGTLFVAASQPLNALAFVVDGLYYGVSDFEYAAYSMLVIGLISSAFIFLAAPYFGLPGVWAGLFLFMTLRVMAGILRLGTRSGPWRLLWSDMEKDDII